MTKSIRERVEAEGSYIGGGVVLVEWDRGNLIPRDEHEATIAMLSESLDQRHDSEAMKIIRDAAKILGPKMIVAKSAIAAAELRGARRAAQHILDVHSAANAIIVAAIRARINVQV